MIALATACWTSLFVDAGRCCHWLGRAGAQQNLFHFLFALPILSALEWLGGNVQATNYF